MPTRHSTEMHRTAPDRGRRESASVPGVRVSSIRVLGPLSVRIDNRSVEVGGPKPTLLLALLVAQAGAVVSLDALIDGLWGDDPPPTARKAVQVHVSNLRRALGEEFPLQTSAGGYRLDDDSVVIDAVEFERTVRVAGAALDDEPGAAATALRGALAGWSGPAYAGLGDCDALAPTISRLTELRLHAQSLFYDARLRLGQHVEVVGDLDALTTDHPYREDLRRLQMLALYRSGRQTEALRVYTRTRALLVDELGIEPSADLRELQGKILDQSPDLDLVAPLIDEPRDDAQRANGYELRERLGADGVGVVYSAYQASTGREVAIKVILPEYANQPDFVERFESEAQHVASLEHPHIVALYDYWRSPEGAYLVMPYVRGGNLRRSVESTRWDPPAVMRVLDQIGSALGHAHRRGIVHGDLNSTKVLLDDDANAYLIDFGIARHRRADAAEPDDGTAGDIRAFGMLAHELLTGARPGPGESPGSVHWSRNDLPQGLDAVIARAVDDPPVRFQRIEDCLRALRQVFGADVTTGPAAPVVDIDIRNPYKGLRAFAEVDADDYFGRDRLLAQLSHRVAQHRLTVVVGPSGSGKSSLVKAGLLPMLRRNGVRPGRPTLITEMYPGSYPFEELEAALLRVAVDRPVDLLDELVADDRGLLRSTKQILPDDSDLVLVVDQFEELFSLTADASVRRLFLDNLVTIGHDERSRVSVVLTMRADFFDHPLEHPAFGELMAEGLVTVAMPDHDDLAQAISEPARAAGLELEAGLVPVITRDVAGEPGALPLMQYALTELVGAREGRELTIEAYERTGGVIGALSGRAEDIFVGLPMSARRVAEEVFVHLVAVDEDSDDTRRRVRRSELDATGFNAAALDAVIAAFGSFRLLSFDHDPVTRGQTIEVAHEALIREWPRFRAWIDQRREGLVLQRRLQVAATDWEVSGRDVSFLLAGGRLEQYERWAATTNLRIGAPERTFLDRSRQRASQVVESATRRRHRLIGGFAVLAAAAVGVAAVALVQRDRADDAASLAQQAAAEADSQRTVAERATSEAEALSRSVERRALIDGARAAGLTAVELADEDPEAAVLVGLEAASIADEAGVALPEVVHGLWEGASQQHVRARFAPGLQKWIEFGQGVSPSPDGRLGVATAAAEMSGTVVPQWESITTVTDLATGETISTLAESQELPLFSTWDPATGDVLTANGDGSVTWWDPLSGAPVRREQLTSGPLWHVTVTDDRLATSENVDRSDGRSIAVLRDRSTLAALAEVPDSRWSTLSPNGRWWATYSVFREIVFHDTRTGVEMFRIPHGLAPSDAMPFTDWAGPDDAMWLLRSNGALAQIDLGADAVMNDVPFDEFVGVFPVRIRSSPDGALLAFGDADARVRIHDVATGEQIVALVGHQSPVDAVEWLPDASGLVTVDRLGTALTWDLVPQSASGLPAVRLAEHPETSAQFGDSVVLLAGRRGSGRLVDTSTGSTIVEFGLTVQGQDLNTVANEQSGVFVAPSDDGLRVYDVNERRWTAEIVVDGIDQPLALSDDSTRLLAGTSPSSRSGASPSAAMLDTETGEELWRIDRFLVDAAVMVDDTVVVAGSQWGHIVRRILVLDIETGDQIALSTRGWTTSAMTVSPDGARLATVRRTGEIIVYDLDLLINSPTGQAEVVSNTATVTELVSQLVYSTDGSMLFSGSVDGALRAWDSETLEQRWSIDNGVSMSGLRVRDDLVWFGQPIDAPSGRGDAGFRLAAIPFDQASIAEWAATTVTRNLTDAECQEYLQRACAIRVDLS